MKREIRPKLLKDIICRIWWGWHAMGVMKEWPTFPKVSKLVPQCNIVSCPEHLFVCGGVLLLCRECKRHILDLFQKCLYVSVYVCVFLGTYALVYEFMRYPSTQLLILSIAYFVHSIRYFLAVGQMVSVCIKKTNKKINRNRFLILFTYYPIYPTPPLGQDMTQGQFSLSGV